MNDESMARLVEVKAGAGRCAVRLAMRDTGRGWVGCLTGGDSPHVGGVVLAIPRLSLSGSGAASCDVYSVPVPGHLDNEVGAPVAQGICSALGSTISLSSGIHLENARPDELQAVQQSCRTVQERFVALVRETRETDYSR